MLNFVTSSRSDGYSTSALIVSILWIQTSFARGARILLVPPPLHSHLAKMQSVGAELAGRGHEVHLVLALNNKNLQRSERNFPTLRSLYFAGADTALNTAPEELERVVMREVFAEVGHRKPFEHFQLVSSLVNSDCENMLSDREFMTRVDSLNFDFAIVDMLTLSPCLYLLPHRVRVPHVASLSAEFRPWLGGAPTLPSFFPINTVSILTDRMTFAQRVWNLILHLCYRTWFFGGLPGWANTTLLDIYAPEMEGSWQRLIETSALFFVSRDQCADWIRPTFPNTILTPGLTLEDPRPLPQQVDQIASSAELDQGLIVVSFGSLTDYLPLETVRKFLDAFSRLKQEVIWKKIIPEELPSTELPRNVHALPWLPQQDLVGHRATRLFIGHCGLNGWYEAIYHGVPIICFPLIGDQHYNALLVETRGYGLSLDLVHFTADQLLAAVETVLSNQTTFLAKTRLASAILRDRPRKPRETVADWIEHVLKFGADHLRSPAADLIWFQYASIDVIAVLISCLLSAICFVIWSVAKLFKYLCKLRAKNVLLDRHTSLKHKKIS